MRCMDKVVLEYSTVTETIPDYRILLGATMGLSTRRDLRDHVHCYVTRRMSGIATPCMSSSQHTVFFLETNTAAIISTRLLHIINQRPTGKKLTAAACSGDGTLPTLQQEHTFSHPMHPEVILPLAIFILVLQKGISGRFFNPSETCGV